MKSILPQPCVFRIIAAGLLLLLAPSFVCACQCAPSEGSRSDRVRREFAQSSAVFSGYVLSSHYANVHGVRTRMADIRVLQSWKGELKPETSIRVISDGESGPMYCGYVAQPGTFLMVYARGQRPFALTTCSLTGALNLAEDDIPLLRELSLPQSGASR